MMRATEVSFPGIGLAETTHRVPRHDSDLCLILVGDPVQNGHRLALAAGYYVDYLIGLQLRGLVGLMRTHLRHVQVAKITAVLTLFSKLRPITATFRPHKAATSITCWTREIREANVATIIRPSAARKMRSNV